MVTPIIKEIYHHEGVLSNSCLPQRRRGRREEFFDEVFFRDLIPDGEFVQDIPEGASGNGIMIGNSYLWVPAGVFFSILTWLPRWRTIWYPKAFIIEMSLLPETEGSFLDMNLTEIHHGE